MKPIEIYTDGGCHGNPGPGGWAFVAQGDSLHESSGNEPQTTNNRMELLAVINALRYATESGITGVRIVTDSQYVKNGITTWIHTWLRNGWRTAARKPVKNQDLWVRLHELDNAVSPDWQWVRGHAGNDLNERCDQLVQQSIAKLESSH